VAYCLVPSRRAEVDDYARGARWNVHMEGSIRDLNPREANIYILDSRDDQAPWCANDGCHVSP
jgi:hypothetical protein